jgi:hypothetical protein
LTTCRFRALKRNPLLKNYPPWEKNIIQTFHFKSPYSVTPKIKELNDKNSTGICWDDGYINYSALYTVLNEAVAGFTHQYAYGDEKCSFLNEITGRTIINLEQFNCPPASHFKGKYQCVSPTTSLITLNVHKKSICFA